MEIGPPNQNRQGLLGPDSIMVVYADLLGLPASMFPGTSARVYLKAHGK